MLANIAILTLFGILLMMLETFVPGWIAGIIGALFILIGAGLFIVAEDFLGWSLGMRVLMATCVLLLAGAVLGVWLKFFAGRFFRRVFTLEATSGAGVAGGQAFTPVGQQGVALTALRPLGRAEIGGRSYDVRCHLGQAEAGARVEVIAAEPGNLLVRALPALT
ncbi:MAG: NfeD family protein [Prosthecobacter sp.]